MPRARCGNDPRAQLTDGDRQAIADFRAYLEGRHQEKTMTELDEARANLEGWLETGDARTALERFEAAVRANERATPQPPARPQLLTLATPCANEACAHPYNWHNGAGCQADDGTKRCGCIAFAIPQPDGARP